MSILQHVEEIPEEPEAGTEIGEDETAVAVNGFDPVATPISSAVGR